VYDRKDQQVITHAYDLTGIREKSIVLTFDDGPGKSLIPILDILKQEEVPAMFFWQTRLLHQNRPWRRLIKEGHQLGSHSCKHPDLRKLDYQSQLRELYYSKKKLEDITGQTIRYFRPPFGQYNQSTLHALTALDMVPILWRVASLDWELKKRPEEIISNVVDNLEVGAIILLHELTQTVQILKQLINEIRKKGYSFSILPM